MKGFILPGLLLLVSSLTPVNAAEVTTCIIDTTIKSNPVILYFPVSATQLRCAPIKDSSSITLGELYENNWRLNQIISPTLIGSKEGKPTYSPTVLYLERTNPPLRPKQSNTTQQPSYKNNDTAEESGNEESSTKKSGGLFGSWFKDDKKVTEEETDDE